MKILQDAFCNKVFNNTVIIGNGSCFAEDLNKTSFYNIYDNIVYLFECSQDTFKYIQIHKELHKYKKWVICISHMHEDHCNAIGSLLYYFKFSLSLSNDNIFIICPDKELMNIYLNITSPNAQDGINIIDNNYYCDNIQIKLFDVKHINSMKSIGFIFSINDINVFAYTGDCTSIPIDVINQYNFGYIYGLITECTLYNNNVHQNIDNLLQQVDNNRLQNVLLMHFDNATAVSIIFDKINHKINQYDSQHKLLALSRLLPGIKENNEIFNIVYNKFIAICDKYTKVILTKDRIDNSLNICNLL